MTDEPTGDDDGRRVRGVLAHVRRSPDLARLVWLKFAMQFGDGMFQASLGGALLFNPERAADAHTIAAGFAVLLLPYSVVGPFAGGLVDRWDRRTVLFVANAVRATMFTLVAILLVAGVGDTPILLAALAGLGISRFAGSAVSAALPHVAPRSWLVATNSFLTTVGSGVTAAGAATAVGVIGLVGPGDLGSAVSVVVSLAGSLVAGFLATRFASTLLGPDHARTRSLAGTVVHALVEGARAVRRAPVAAGALTGLGAHRVVFGLDTLVMVLYLRAADASAQTAFVGFGAAAASTALGMLVAAVTTPILLAEVERRTAVLLGLSVALVVQTAIAAWFGPTALILGGFGLGLAGQTVKLTADTSLQLDVPDEDRGKVFALQDTIFNIAFLGAIAAGAAFVAPDGRSPLILAIGAVVYLVALVAVGIRGRR